MAKKQSAFEDKVKKKGMKFGKICPTCGESLSYAKKIEPITRDNGAIGFSERILPYCKCNIKEVLET
jgi:hypothetical protein